MQGSEGLKGRVFSDEPGSRALMCWMLDCFNWQKRAMTLDVAGINRLLLAAAAAAAAVTDALPPLPNVQPGLYSPAAHCFHVPRAR